MIFEFIMCWFWAIGVFLSFVGWGTLIVKIALRNQIVGWGQKAALGASAAVFIGGILNYFSLIYTPVLLTQVALGWFFFVCDYTTVTKQCNEFFSSIRSAIKDRRLLILALLTAGCIVWVYTRSIYTFPPGELWKKSFNVHDDYHGYLIYPNKMIQTHTLSDDPFSTRQMVSSLGGSYYLQTFVRCLFSEEFIRSMDQSIGFLILVFLVWELSRQKNLPISVVLWLIFLISVTPVSVYIANITSFVLSIALFLSLYSLLDGCILRQGQDRLCSNALIVALVASALCALKTTNSITAGCFVATVYGYRLFRSGKRYPRIAFEFLCVAVLVVLMLLPWMLIKYQSYGTALYPILGRGYHVYGGTDYSANPFALLSPLRMIKILIVVMGDIYYVALFMLAVITPILCKTNRSLSVCTLSLIFAGIMGIAAIVLGMGGVALTRYSFPFVFICIIVLLIDWLVFVGNQKEYAQLIKPFGVVLIVCGMIFGDAVRDFFEAFYSTAKQATCLSENIQLTSDEERQRYAQMQNSIPESAILLTRLEKPFLLNFQRNTIYAIDMPGETSPPPGIPIRKGPDALAQYLISKSVRYVAYSYATQAGFTHAGYDYRLNPKSPPWSLREARGTFDFQDNITLLMKTKKLIYDDGNTCVLDLYAYR